MTKRHFLVFFAVILSAFSLLGQKTNRTIVQLTQQWSKLHQPGKEAELASLYTPVTAIYGEFCVQQELQDRKTQFFRRVPYFRQRIEGAVSVFPLTDSLCSATFTKISMLGKSRSSIKARLLFRLEKDGAWYLWSENDLPTENKIVERCLRQYPQLRKSATELAVFKLMVLTTDEIGKKLGQKAEKVKDLPVRIISEDSGVYLIEVQLDQSNQGATTYFVFNKISGRLFLQDRQGRLQEYFDFDRRLLLFLYPA
jgi:hypothetical protein